MMAAETGKLIECGICLEILDDSHKMLPCQHSFHKSCLERIIQEQIDLSCPICRMSVAVPINSLQSNIMVSGLIDCFKKHTLSKPADTEKKELALASAPSQKEFEKLRPLVGSNAFSFTPFPLGPEFTFNPVPPPSASLPISFVRTTKSSIFQPLTDYPMFRLLTDPHSLFQKLKDSSFQRKNQFSDPLRKLYMKPSKAEAIEVYYRDGWSGNCPVGTLIRKPVKDPFSLSSYTGDLSSSSTVYYRADEKEYGCDEPVEYEAMCVLRPGVRPT